MFSYSRASHFLLYDLIPSLPKNKIMKLVIIKYRTF